MHGPRLNCFEMTRATNAYRSNVANVTLARAQYGGHNLKSREPVPLFFCILWQQKVTFKIGVLVKKIVHREFREAIKGRKGNTEVCVCVCVRVCVCVCTPLKRKL